MDQAEVEIVPRVGFDASCANGRLTTGAANGSFQNGRGSYLFIGSSGGFWPGKAGVRCLRGCGIVAAAGDRRALVFGVTGSSGAVSFS